MKVKICGLTNLEDAQVAVEASADFLGFIFYEPSPRYVSLETVRMITGHLARLDQPPLFVGVFVDAPLATIRHVLAYCRLDAAQLHGAEPAEFVNQLQGRAYKALRPQSEAEAEDLITRYRPAVPAFPPSLPAFLLDAYHPALYGGTGHVADWSLAAALARRYPVMLAGSLTPANVAEAVGQVRPWGVDVSSGVEAGKGKKDHDKVRAFVKAAKRKGNI